MKKSFPTTCYDCGVGLLKPVTWKMDLSFNVPIPLTVKNLLGKNCELCGAIFITSRQVKKNEVCIQKAKRKSQKKAILCQKRRILWERRVKSGKRALFRLAP